MSPFALSLFRRLRTSVSYGFFPQVTEQRERMLGILKKIGTPLFYCDRAILLYRYELLNKALLTHWHDSIVAYSFKTNYTVAKSNIFKHLGAWAEVISMKEFQMARALRYKGSTIIYNGPVKKERDLEKAMRLKSLIHIDNTDELKTMMRLSKKMSGPVRIGIRLNTQIKGWQSRFGFSIDSGEAKNIIDDILTSNALQLVSLHMHIGTDIDDPSMYHKAASAVASIGILVPGLQYIDMGGGFPAHGLPPYGKRFWDPQEIDCYIQAITRGLSSVIWKRKPILIVEPGRYLVDDAEIYIVRIMHSLISKNIQHIVCDGTITMIPLKHYRPQIVRRYDALLMSADESHALRTYVYGASCSESDIMHQGLLPRCKNGDYLIFFAVGAYNQSMGSEFMLEKHSTFLSLT